MTTRTDTFDRADSSSLGADWTEDSGDWAIVSNNVRQNTTGNSYRKLRWSGAAMDSADYSVEVVARSGGLSNGIGPAARCAASSTVTYYAYIIFGGDAAYLVEITGGSESVLATGSSVSANTNYTLRLEVEGSTIRCYLNGSLDIETTDASLTSGPPGFAAYGGNNANTYATTWTATDLASGTIYYSTPTGSLTPSGAIVRRPSKTPTGSLTPTGRTARRTSKTPTGSLTPTGRTARRTSKTPAGALGLAGALSAVRTVLANMSGALGLAGAVGRSTAKGVAGAFTPAGAVGRNTAKGVAGAFTPAGAVGRSMAKVITGVLGLAGDVAAEISGYYQQAVGGALSLAGALNRTTARTLTGSLALSGAVIRQIAKTIGGILNLVGNVGRNWISPFEPKLDVTLVDMAQTTLTVANMAQTTLTVANAAQTTLTVANAAQTVLTIGDATK